MLFHYWVRISAAGIFFLGVVMATLGADKPKSSLFTPAQISDGWIALFDGESTFGFEIKGRVRVEDGQLIIGGQSAGSITTVSEFDPNLGMIKVEFRSRGEKPVTLKWSDDSHEINGSDSGQISWRSKKFVTSRYSIEVPEGTEFTIERLAFQPMGIKPLFNGKDLNNWNVFKGEPKRELSKFSVTPYGEISLKNGPGDLQSKQQFENFFLQLECKTNGTALNSGIFFRCLPDQYQQGYEAQIHNGFLNNDRSKPSDFGTGAIYRRIATRKVVPNDREWFTMTVQSNGANIATWVNGYPTVNWTDDRKPAENARQGLYTKRGPISIQGHDPTTDLLFRKIRISELTK